MTTDRIAHPSFEYVSSDGVAVSKVGGGTIGRSYGQEHWLISALSNGSWTEPERLYVGRAATHGQVSAMARDFLTLREALDDDTDTDTEG